MLFWFLYFYTNFEYAFSIFFHDETFIFLNDLVEDFSLEDVICWLSRKSQQRCRQATRKLGLSGHTYMHDIFQTFPHLSNQRKKSTVYTIKQYADRCFN